MPHDKNPLTDNRFPFVFLAIFFTQFILWRLVIFADFNYWVTKIDIFGKELRSFELIFNPLFDAPHPGTFFLLITQIFRSIGFSSNYSLLITEILLNTILISIICLLSYFLFPKKLWWLSIGVFFIFNNFAFYSNPVDIVVSELIIIAFLSAMWHFSKTDKTPTVISITLGAALGLALASRIHITSAISLILLIGLLFVINWRRLLLITTTTILTAWLFIPYLWKNPLDILSFFSYTSSLYDSSTISLRHGYHVSILEIISSAPLASLSFVLLILLIALPKKISLVEIPKRFLLTLFATITITSGIILRSNMVDIRFLYPLFFLSQIFLPLFLLELLNIIFRKITKKSILQNKKLLASLMIAVNCAAFLFLTTYVLIVGFMYERTLLLTLQIQFLIMVILLTTARPSQFQTYNSVAK